MNQMDKDSETAPQICDTAAACIQENSSKSNNGNLQNSDKFPFHNNEAPIFTTDVVPRTGMNDSYQCTLQIRS